MKRIVLICLALAALVSAWVIGTEMMQEHGSDQRAAPVADQAAQVAQGAYLARVGNCMACHTAQGGKEYAGGRVIETRFGRMYSPNVTPDEATGIGSWSADDFWRALHNGKSKDGSLLYPAFPYPNYTKVTRADSDALFAYFQALAPVKQANREHELAFPYNQRILLAFWRKLYFMPGEYQPQADKSAEWNRGAYMVQGLAHCSSCHSARTSLGGLVDAERLGGGMMASMDWYAPALSSAPHALGTWSQADIAGLLKTGVSGRGAVFGPMAEVVGASLQHVSSTDIDAMALYLKSLPATAPDQRGASVGGAGNAEAVLRAGAQLYEQNCASCHAKDGKGAPPAYPPLAGNQSMAGASSLNTIRIVLNGGFPPSTGGNPRPYGMPPFGTELTDEEVAAVVSFVRSSWGNEGKLVSPVDVSRARGTPVH